jgi:hypothetical protein
MSTTSRRISAKRNANRNSHTPGKDKGAFCVRRPAAEMACSMNPYKGQGIPAKYRDGYTHFWDTMKAVNK